jgi:argininosuccinate lyase
MTTSSHSSNTAAQPAKHLWGGRFATPPDASLQRLSQAPASHLRLLAYDLTASQSHARELLRAGLLRKEECEQMVDALRQLIDESQSGATWCQAGEEDIHTLAERMLVQRLGDLGGKLRAGRSRNDQAANDLKLYLRCETRRIAQQVLQLIAALQEQALRHADTVTAGMTHLQSAQPISFGHHLLAHAQGLSRDVSRMMNWDDRHATSPLGAAALAGSAIALRNDLSAPEMGYLSACENSMDAVGSRDHVAEYLFTLAMLAVNLSRLSEEIILWTSQPFSWVRLDDAFSTGSSIMPQKKNPDIAELARGRSGRLIGHVTAMLATLKSLPFAYNRDLSEDKHLAFDATDTLAALLPAMSGMVRTMKADVTRMREQASMGFSLATELADHLARQGVPFAQAHEITGQVVRYCEEQGLTLQALSVAQLSQIHPLLDEKAMAVLDLDQAMTARSGYGGTAPERVREQAHRLARIQAKQLDWSQAYQGPAFPALTTEATLGDKA